MTAVTLDPESVLLARGRFASSARNVLAGRMLPRPRAGRAGLAELVTVKVGRSRLSVAVTTETIGALGLSAGDRVFLYVKATAVRRVGRPTRGSRRR